MLILLIQSAERALRLYSTLQIRRQCVNNWELSTRYNKAISAYKRVDIIALDNTNIQAKACVCFNKEQSLLPLEHAALYQR